MAGHDCLYLCETSSCLARSILRLTRDILVRCSDPITSSDIPKLLLSATIKEAHCASAVTYISVNRHISLCPLRLGRECSSQKAICARRGRWVGLLIWHRNQSQIGNTYMRNGDSNIIYPIIANSCINSKKPGEA